MERNPALFTTILVLIHCLIPTLNLAATANGSIATDQDALLAVKAHITDDPTNFLAKNWNISTSVCNWIGVTCDNINHRVTAFNLSGLNLTGTIPFQLGNLSSLQTLDLSSNRLFGTIPSSIFSIKTLKLLNLTVNQLSGSFPSFDNMSSVQTLDFRHNYLHGELPANICSYFPYLKFLYLKGNMFYGEIPTTLSKCKPLQYLTLSYNNFSGAIPREMGELTKLETLALTFNSLQGEIPQEIGNLSNLEYLGLDHNNLIGVIPTTIFNISTMEELGLNGNKLRGEIPHEIGNLRNLEYLKLDFNNLTGVVPATLFNMSAIKLLSLSRNSLMGSLPSRTDLELPNLEELSLSFNNFSGPIPSFIYNASKLSILEMETNSFSGVIPDTFGNLTNLEWLNLSDNYLTSSTPELSFLSSLTNCKNLKALQLHENPLHATLPSFIGSLSNSMEIIYMFNCSISGRIPEEIANLKNLIELDLEANELDKSIPISMGRMQKLQGLYLGINHLEGSIPDDLCHLAALSELGLQGNKLSGSIPACLGNLLSLRKLDLNSNGLTSNIPSTFWHLKDILSVSLSSNSLTGSLPLEIGNLKVVIEMDLSKNHFSGDIPSTITGLKDLQILSLGNNRLTGSIPQSFGDLTSLEFLDLSSSNLSGVIPKSMEKILHLKYLNLSFNRLGGEIPRGGSFANFSAESFIGNDLLCGSPNLQVPPCESSKTDINRKSSRKNVLLLGIVLPLSAAFIVALGFVLICRCRKRSTKLPNDANMSPRATQRRFSYLEILRATDRFNESSVLGSGSFGSVYKATLQDGMEVAVKVFHLQFEGALKSFDAECAVMKSIRHRNLVKIISSCSNDDFKALVLEYMPNGSLEKCLYSDNCILDIFQRLNIMIDVASALEYLHFGYSTPIVHCDLKPSNVLLDENMVAHLSDFGIAKLLNGEDQSITQTQTLATIGYMAPEYGREGKISRSGDIYSYGIMLMETFTKKKPTDEFFVGEMSLKSWVNDLLNSSVMELIDTNLLSREDQYFTAKEQCVSSILNLALDCTAESPKKRINSKQIATKLLKIKDTLLKIVRGRRRIIISNVN